MVSNYLPFCIYAFGVVPSHTDFGLGHVICFCFGSVANVIQAETWRAVVHWGLSSLQGLGTLLLLTCEEGQTSLLDDERPVVLGLLLLQLTANKWKQGCLAGQQLTDATWLSTAEDQQKKAQPKCQFTELWVKLMVVVFRSLSFRLICYAANWYRSR